MYNQVKMSDQSEATARLHDFENEAKIRERCRLLKEPQVAAGCFHQHVTQHDYDAWPKD
jgi:hypothetical protein